MNRPLLPLSLAVLLLITVNAVAASQPLMSTSEATALVKKTVETQRLVARTDCVDYVFAGTAAANVDTIDVVEKHGGICAGDPGTAPRLFSVYVDLQTRQMASDKDDPVDGALKMLLP